MLRRGGARDPLLSEAGAGASDAHADAPGSAGGPSGAGGGSKVEETAQGGAGAEDGEDDASQFECHICLETAAGALRAARPCSCWCDSFRGCGH